ncbi:Gfo/Idh/MocA family protein [Thalassotalea sp. PLHSN55]|uniref:Gfo/Idh/MocA family protein n=1 Tax=Thalassotalea sp. PLHSN55 TaxID=3435888 RepID=UPI003F828DA8
MAKRKLRMGMIGGGSGAFIGAVHRIAAQIDGQVELVCGAFSADQQRSKDSGEQLFLPSERCYGSYEEMIITEQELPADQRMEFVVIVTPNHLHYPAAKLALEAGFHVLSDKPATLSLAQALSLKTIIEQSNCLYGLTHTYTGYPLIKHAQELVADNTLGTVQKIVVEYHQGWLADQEAESGKQASWRLDPSQSGISCCMGDIGVHAANLAEYVSGLTISKMCADLVPVVPGRQLDDDGTVLLRFNNGAKGALLASQIAVGEENGLRLRIYGDKASIDWSQQEPNTLWLKFNDQASQMIRTGVGQFSSRVQSAIRTPAGHPEGYLEAFANIYVNFVEQVRLFQQGELDAASQVDVPDIEDAIRGMAFIENAVAASNSDQKWHNFTI